MKNIYTIRFLSSLLLLFFTATTSAGPLDDFKRNRRKILQKYRQKKRLIQAEFKGFAKEIETLKPGVKIHMPIQLPRSMPGMKMRGTINIKRHNAPPGETAPRKVYAFVSKEYEIKGEPRGEYGIADVNKGDRVEVVLMLRNALSDDNPNIRWCLIRTSDSEEGYIPNTFLRAEKKFKPAPVKKGVKYVKTQAGLSLRESPSTDGNLIARLPYMARVKVIRYGKVRTTVDGIDDYWAKIRYRRINGWVFNGYLKSRKEPKPFGRVDDKPFIMPVGGSRTSDFGPRIDPLTKRVGSFHSGVDIAAPRGTPILAALTGIIIKAGWGGGYGKLIMIEHDNGLVTYYAHQSRFSKKTGDDVIRGQVIGYVGSTGRSTGPHLHFEVRIGGTAKNPDVYLPR